MLEWGVNYLTNITKNCRISINRRLSVMSEIKYTILESWPALKEDLQNFLSDTDAWVISELKKAHEANDWETVLKVIDVVELVHNMSHSH